MREIKDLSGLVATRFFTDAAQSVDKNLRVELADQVRSLQRHARKLSSGRFKTQTLRAMGHPYAKRHGRAASGRFQRHAAAVPYGDAGIINRQSGTFKDGWKIDRVRFSGGREGLVAGLRNDAPHAKYIFRLGGTKRMIARPILRKLEQHHQQNVERRVRALLEKRFS